MRDLTLGGISGDGEWGGGGGRGGGEFLPEEASLSSLYDAVSDNVVRYK